MLLSAPGRRLHSGARDAHEVIRHVCRHSRRRAGWRRHDEAATIPLRRHARARARLAFSGDVGAGAEAEFVGVAGLATARRLASAATAIPPMRDSDT